MPAVPIKTEGCGISTWLQRTVGRAQMAVAPFLGRWKSGLVMADPSRTKDPALPDDATVPGWKAGCTKTLDAGAPPNAAEQSHPIPTNGTAVFPESQTLRVPRASAAMPADRHSLAIEAKETSMAEVVTFPLRADANLAHPPRADKWSREMEEEEHRLSEAPEDGGENGRLRNSHRILRRSYRPGGFDDPL